MKKSDWWNTKTRWRLLLLNYILGTSIILWAVFTKQDLELIKHIFTEIGLVHIAYIGGDSYRPSKEIEEVKES